MNAALYVNQALVAAIHAHNSVQSGVDMRNPKQCRKPQAFRAGPVMALHDNPPKDRGGAPKGIRPYRPLTH